MKPARLLLLALLLSGCGSPWTKVPSQESGASGGQTAASGDNGQAPRPDIRLSIVDYEGILDHVAKNRGKVVVMDAWSTSCAPCLKEFHNLVELHKKYGPDQVACISLSFDFEGIGKPEEQQERVLSFLLGQAATFENLLSSDESDVLYRKFKLASVPAVFVYDRTGQLRRRFDNQKAKTAAEAFTYSQVRDLVAELLKEDGSGVHAEVGKR